MNFAPILKEVGRGERGARDLTFEEAKKLFGAMLDGGVPDLELGALLIAFRFKTESLTELLGFHAALDERIVQLKAPQASIMLQHAYYSVISPEGCAGILWKIATEETKPRAADALRLTSRHLKEYGVVDHVIQEPLGGAHRGIREMGNTVKTYLTRTLRELTAHSRSDLLAGRYQKFRQLGRHIN